MNDETITLLDYKTLIYKQHPKYSTLALTTKKLIATRIKYWERSTLRCIIIKYFKHFLSYRIIVSPADSNSSSNLVLLLLIYTWSTYNSELGSYKWADATLSHLKRPAYLQSLTYYCCYLLASSLRQVADTCTLQIKPLGSALCCKPWWKLYLNFSEYQKQERNFWRRGCLPEKCGWYCFCISH